MKRIMLAAAMAAPLAFAGCGGAPVSSAAEHGLRQDLKAVCELTEFRETATEEMDAAGGRSAVVRFEGEVKWLTLEEALSSRGAAKDAQEYLSKLAYASARFGGAKAGATSRVRGAVLLAKTDIGWLYKGLAER
jgi:hypothetical protein